MDSVDKSNWSETNEGIDEVMGEMTRIIKQFSVMLKKLIWGVVKKNCVIMLLTKKRNICYERLTRY